MRYLLLIHRSGAWKIIQQSNDLIAIAKVESELPPNSVSYLMDMSLVQGAEQ